MILMNLFNPRVIIKLYVFIVHRIFPTYLLLKFYFYLLIFLNLF